ncbi:hypothetical protein [Thalassobaculum sp.]|uniref:hypothetical protein n=1 Tax=Thalassobaculum sp. TaxID=2022740 RepID=UPI0032ED436B
MQRRHRFGRYSQRRLEIGLAALQGGEAVPDLLGTKAIDDGIDDLVEIALNPLEFGFLIDPSAVALVPEPVELGVEMGNEIPHRLGLHQLPLQAFQDTRLDHVAADCQGVAAGAGIARARAAVVVAVHAPSLRRCDNGVKVPLFAYKATIALLHATSGKCEV